ncbi:hypothetical protein BJY52DRAFT_1290694 [Lactarius psammicola]|nr:hypothetical protein BJY52DRAFT_1290694 [Lactarius psammicola]
MNGAQQGVAVFGADHPNLSALLYDPSQPVGERISTLRPSCGCITLRQRSFPTAEGVAHRGVRPTIPERGPHAARRDDPEHRLALRRAEPDKCVTVPGLESCMRVSLVAATPSTHGNATGGRTIFPAL